MTWSYECQIYKVDGRYAPGEHGSCSQAVKVQVHVPLTSWGGDAPAGVPRERKCQSDGLSQKKGSDDIYIISISNYKEEFIKA